MTTTFWMLAVYAAGIVGFVMGMVVAALLAGNRYASAADISEDRGSK